MESSFATAVGRPGRRSVLLLGGALVALVALAVTFSLAYRGNVVDDALISFRYAQNLVEGRGLVFNPGERVEGYTNFLWTMVLAALYAVAGSPGAMVPLAVAATVACAAAAVVLVWLLGRRIWGDDPLPTFVALGLVVLDNAYGVWAIQALEGHFLLVLMLLALYVADRRPRGWPVLAGVLIAAAQMTRPDAALFAVAAGACGLAEALRLRLRGEEGAGAVARGWLLAAAVAAAVYGAYFAWRYSYYGFLLPNTFYVKVGGSQLDAWSRGLEYLRSYFADRAWVPLLALLAVPLVRSQIVRTLLVFVALHLAYVARVGGDFYPGHRFLLVVTPPLALLCGAAVHLVCTWLGRLAGAETAKEKQAIGRRVVAVAVLGLVALVAVTGLRKGPYETEIRRWGEHVERSRRFSEWLRDFKEPGARMVVGDIGTAGFFADVPVIDVYGIVDPHVAHQEVENLGRGKAGHEKIGSRAYLLSTRPKYIKQGYVPGDLYRDGYYRSGDVPAELSADWLWIRDDLASTGSFLPGTAVTFDSRPEGWVGRGAAFARWPTRGMVRGQSPVSGHDRGHVNTFVDGKGDAATGTLRSAPFRLEGDKLVLRVGGGNDPERLRVSLIVDGARVFSETGHDTEVLTRRVWDIAPYRGREATLEIVDESTGGWGHILVDEIVQWAASPPQRAGGLAEQAP